MRRTLLLLLCCLTTHAGATAHTFTVPLQNNAVPYHKSYAPAHTYPLDISFCIADIKFTNNSVKILELGEGSRSKFAGFDALYGTGSIWSRFWHYLAQFNVPMFYIGPKPEKQWQQEQIAYQDFCNLGGRHIRSKDTCSKMLAKKHRYAHPIIPPKNISNCHAITILHHQNAASPAAYSFKKKHPFALVLNYAIAPYVNNKFLTNALFDDAALAPYKPTWQTYPKRYSTSLASNIIQEINADIFVIKPLNAFRGNGVIMVRKEQLDYVLKNILQKRGMVRNSTNPTYSYWKRDVNDNFIVEKFEPSKSICVNGVIYEPTLRMVFAMHHSDGMLSLTYFGGYWKLPAIGMYEKGTLSERTKSSIDKTGKRPSSAMVSTQDMRTIKNILNGVLPKLYTKMLQNRYVMK